MRLLQGMIELLAPTRCAGCDLPGGLLCAECRASLPEIDADHACPSCGAPFGAMVCTECWSTEFAFAAALSLGELDGALARAVVLHKDAGERRLGALLGGMLATAVAERWAGWADAVCWIPATSAAVARRGFDHSAALAEPVAATLSAPGLAAPVAVSSARPAASGSDRAHRKLARDVRCRRQGTSKSARGRRRPDDRCDPRCGRTSAARGRRARGQGRRGRACVVGE